MAVATRTAVSSAVKKQELVTEDMSFMESMAGQGLDTITNNEQALGYLSMVQPGSQFESDDCPAGSWRNSATGKCYGNTVRVIPLAFRTIWNERASEAPFGTVGRYAPNSIKVEMKMPPAGKRGYPKMINPDTGNEVQELYVYAVILPDYPEDGVLYFNPTVSSMRTCKSWNTQLKGQILPNGAQAPIFAYSWNMFVELVTNPKKTSEEIAKFTKVTKDAICTKDIFTEQVQPQLAIVQTEVLAITESAEVEED